MTGPTQLIGTSADPSSLLNRDTSSSALSPLQAQVDQLVTDFSQRAADWKSLAAMVAGGMAFQTGRIGVMSTGVQGRQLLSLVVGLGTEVTAYELSSRALASLGEGNPNRNLWKWNGVGGIKQGLLSSLVTFGTLKGFGKFAQGQNLILQHGAQDAGLVLGHQLVYHAGIGPRPEGTIAQQFLNAEITNLQLSAGMALGRGLAPFQSQMEMAGRLEEKAGKNTGDSSIMFGKPAFAGVALPGGEIPIQDRNAPVLMMANMGSGGGSGGKNPGRKSAEALELGDADLEELHDPPIPASSAIVPRDSDGTRYRPPTYENSPPPAPAQLEKTYVGQTIDGRYRVETPLGQGAMGIVYTCTHEILDKKFAMKVLQPEYAQKPELGDRFLNEARAAAAAAKNNPHIIEISDFGRLPDGAPYFIMEFLEGEPLYKVVEGQKPTTITRALHIADQLADGLSAAHQAGVIHRDLKPDNIFLIRRGKEVDFVKILDFGIAKLNSSGNKKLTQPGHAMGTPQYMSPEQAFGGEIDARSDIYSFGVILYELTTGKPPFDELQDVTKILTAQMYKTPTPIHELEGLPHVVPQALEAIIDKCLQKRPEDRYQSMEQVIADLDALKEGKTPVAVPEMENRLIAAKAKSSRLSLYIGIGGLGIGATTALTALILSSGHAGSTSTGSSATPPPSAPPPPSNKTPVVIAPLPSNPEEKKKVKEVLLTVDPVDAHVFQGDKDLGSNPIIKVEEGSPVELEIRRDGYKSKKITVNGSQDEQSVHLDREKTPRPKTARPTPSSSAQTKPKPKNESDGFVNPWKDPPK